MSDNESCFICLIISLDIAFHAPLYLPQNYTSTSSQPGREDAYREILYDRELLLEDRVGFACRFLSDARLLKFVGSQCSEEVAVGNIRAIVLTG